MSLGSLGGSECGTCNDCRKNIGKNWKNIECGFYEKTFCFICSHLDKPAFEALSVVQSVSWYCLHCINAVPGVSKVLVRLGTVESQCQLLDDRVTTLESNESASDEQIKKLAREELEKIREIEGRRLNVMVFNVPESKQEAVKVRQTEDTDLIQNIMKPKTNLDMQDIQVVNPTRVGRREIINGEITKKRPFRFSVKVKG